MSTSTIYATGTHKQKESYGCYGVGLLTGKAKKTKDYIGQFDSKSKTETQLNILIYSIALALEDKDVSEIKIYSDFALVKSIIDGTIDLWESKNWKKETGTTVSNSDLWKEIFDLLQKHDITFFLMEVPDIKMSAILKKVKDETRKMKKTEPLYEDIVADVVEDKEEKQVSKPVTEEAEEATVSTPAVEEKAVVSPSVVEKKPPVTSPVIENKSPAKAENSTIKIDSELKKESEKLFMELGMPLDVAVSLLLKNAIRNQGFDFKIKLDD